MLEAIMHACIKNDRRALALCERMAGCLDCDLGGRTLLFRGKMLKNAGGQTARQYVIG